jgi:hypothetical protein
VTTGPFDITYDQIQALGPRFTGFANKLLEVEIARHGLAGNQLSVTHNETASDGGVDAALRGSPGTGWLLAGHTAFQFKRSSQSAAACAAEFSKATYAHEIVKNGGNYVVALGGDGLPDQNLSDRHAAVLAKAVDLGILTETDSHRIRVYGADDLARWASEYPSLAVDQVLGSVNPGAVDYSRWRESRLHGHPFSPDPKRTQQIAELRHELAQVGLIDIRLQGDSGLGKTRLAMEALDDERFRSLVAYIPVASEIGGGLIESLIDRGRHVILVVDECPAIRHQKYIERLNMNSAVKLITIGDIGASRSSSPAVRVEPLADDAMEALLDGFPSLATEARRFVQAHSRGSPRDAIWLAQAVERAPRAQAAELIARDDLTTFITDHLPDGADFFFAAALALFERVGWDRDLRPQMELLAAFAGTTPEHLDILILELASHDLIRPQGRYRAIDPLPVAIYLAAEGWRQYGSRIVNELLPRLPGDMVLALFRRLGALGQFEPATAVLPSLIASDGPFGDLHRIEDRDFGALVTQLAIVMPDDVATHLSMLIESATLDELRSLTGSRRDLVWTLEKLVWHIRTFEIAADSLLKLALAENEAYANNATGTWLDLFGSTLPGTAALPEQRLGYLRQAAADPRAVVRLLVVQATEKGLRPHESIAVSGEIQGGVLVEPRGSAKTWADVGQYRRELLVLLNELRSDEDNEVARAAADVLRNALHFLIDDPFAGTTLRDMLLTFTGDDLRQLRVDLEHYVHLHRRHDIDHNQRSKRFLAAAESLQQRLPPVEGMEEVDLLLRLQRFDLAEGELRRRMACAVSNLGSADRLGVLERLSVEQPASYELGRALAEAGGQSTAVVDALVGHFEANPNALVGYLQGLVAKGNEFAYDEFLGSEAASGLDLRSKLNVAVTGPATSSARERVAQGIADLSVRDAAAVMFRWGQHLDDEAKAAMLVDWVRRVADQDDYNAAVDWVGITLLDEPVASVLLEPIWDLLKLRSSYPSLGHQKWSWAGLAGGLIERHSMELLALLLDLIENDTAMVHAGDEDAGLIQACLKHDPEPGWAELGRRLEQPDQWRLPVRVCGWIQSDVPVDVFKAWVGSSVERARIVASITDVGAAEPTDLAVFLLETFDDDRVRSSLSATFRSGSWVGSWSSRITGQIEQLTGWMTDRANGPGVRRWAKDMVDSLRLDRDAAIEREEERGY